MTQPTESEQRRAAAVVKRHALSPMDAAALMEILGIEPDVFHLRWARTVQIGEAGYVTLALDLDVRALTGNERGFVRALCKTLGELIALSEQRTG